MLPYLARISYQKAILVDSIDRMKGQLGFMHYSGWKYSDVIDKMKEMLNEAEEACQTIENKGQ